QATMNGIHVNLLSIGKTRTGGHFSGVITVAHFNFLKPFGLYYPLVLACFLIIDHFSFTIKHVNAFNILRKVAKFVASWPPGGKLEFCNLFVYAFNFEININIMRGRIFLVKSISDHNLFVEGDKISESR